MTSTLKLSDSCKLELPKLLRLAYDDEVYSIIDILCKEQFDDKTFREITKKMYRDYRKLYSCTHPRSNKEISLRNRISDDPRYQKFLEDVELAYGALGQLMNEVQKPDIDSKLLLSSIRVLTARTGSIKENVGLKNFILTDGKSIRRSTGFWKKIAAVIGIGSALGLGNIMGSKDVGASASNRPISEMIKPEVIKRAETEKITIGEAMRRMEAERIAAIEKAKKEAKDEKDRFENDYNYVVKNRKSIIARVKKVLSKEKMPTDYITPRHILSLIWQESRYDPNIISSAGAVGLMQVMNGSKDIEKNIKEGIKVLKQKEAYCRSYYKEKWDTMTPEEKIDILFAIYNCGEGTWEKYGSNLAQQVWETQKHIKSIHYFEAYNNMLENQKNNQFNV
jgi:hypothetical protein